MLTKTGLLIGLLWATGTVALAQTRVEDPIFGLAYNPSEIKYEKVPSRLRRVCPEFDPHNYSVYADVRRGESEFFIVMHTSSGDGDSFGNTIWGKGAECRVDESNWTLSGIPPTNGYLNVQSAEGLPGLDAPKVCENRPRGEYCRYILRSPAEEELLRGLVRDGLQRAVKAFGKSQFKKKECSAEAISQQSDYPIIQQELRKFCSTPD